MYNICVLLAAGGRHDVKVGALVVPVAAPNSVFQRCGGPWLTAGVLYMGLGLEQQTRGYSSFLNILYYTVLVRQGFSEIVEM